MRHSNRWLRGKLGGCHLLMLLLKVFFFFFFLFYLFFFPRLCKAPPSIGLWRQGCSAVPSGRAGTGCAGGDRGDSGPQGLLAVKSQWVLPVVVLQVGCGWSEGSLHPTGMFWLVLHCSWPRDSDTSHPGCPESPRKGFGSGGGPGRRNPAQGFASTTKPFKPFTLHHRPLLLPLHPLGEILAVFCPYSHPGGKPRLTPRGTEVFGTNPWEGGTPPLLGTKTQEGPDKLQLPFGNKRINLSPRGMMWSCSQTPRGGRFTPPSAAA